MNWKLLAWGLAAGVVLGVGLIVWPPTGPSLAIEIQQRGGKVQLARDETLLVRVMLNGPQFVDADATKLAQVSSIQSVSFENSAITREALRRLLPLSELRSLNLNRTHLVPESLDDIARFTALQQLHLAGCLWFRDDDLRRLEPLQQLEELILSETTIGAVGVEHLRQLPSLRVLKLNSCHTIQDDAVESLSQLTKLKVLDLTSCEISSRGLMQLHRALSNTRIVLPVNSLCDLRPISSKIHFDTGSPPDENTITSFRVAQLFDSNASLTPEQYAEAIAAGAVETESQRKLSPGDLASLAHLTDISSITLNASNVTDEMLLELGTRPVLKALSLQDTQVTDEGMKKALAGFPNLSSLSLRGTRVSEPGLRWLLELPQLQHLQIQVAHESALMDILPKLSRLEHLVVHAPLTDTGFVRLPAHPQLVSLQIHAFGLRPLPQLTQLERLQIHVSTELECFGPLSQLPRLARLEIHAPITDAGLLRLPSLPKLTVLEIYDARIVGPGLAALTRAPNLTYLHFSEVPLQDDPFIEALAQLKSLCIVRLHRTGVTRAACERLRKLRPDLNVQWCDPNTSEWVTLE